MACKKNTSFVQFVKCNICSIHHNYGLKHVYSLKHKKTLKTVLEKCVQKVNSCKAFIKSPELHEEEWEANAKFWCYFCNDEYIKHCLHNKFMVAGLGLIHHYASAEHYESAKKFFRENRSKEKVEKYVVKKSALLKFLEDLALFETAYGQNITSLYSQDACTENEARNAYDHESVQHALDSTYSTSCINLYDNVEDALATKPFGESCSTSMSNSISLNSGSNGPSAHYTKSSDGHENPVIKPTQFSSSKSYNLTFGVMRTES